MKYAPQGAEMFDLDLKLASGLQPASKRHTPPALLASLRDAHSALTIMACFATIWERALQVAEMFDLDLKLASGLQPASKRQILSALLASLRDAHWA